jgi:hypothetical protein
MDLVGAFWGAIVFAGTMLAAGLVGASSHPSMGRRRA